jgi:hypothetical protein
MRIVVDIAPGAMADFTAWRESLDTNPFVARRLATAYTDALFQLLKDTRGLPTTGRADTTASPRRYWHELTSGTWAEYTITTAGNRFTRRIVIRIVRLVPLPPRQSVPTAPPPGSP